MVQKRAHICLEKLAAGYAFQPMKSHWSRGFATQKVERAAAACPSVRYYKRQEGSQPSIHPTMTVAKETMILFWW